MSGLPFNRKRTKPRKRPVEVLATDNQEPTAGRQPNHEEDLGAARSKQQPAKSPKKQKLSSRAEAPLVDEEEPEARGLSKPKKDLATDMPGQHTAKPQKKKSKSSVELPPAGDEELEEPGTDPEVSLSLITSSLCQVISVFVTP
jgi:hypothetical protein